MGRRITLNSWLVPKYDEDTLLALSTSFIIAYIINLEFRSTFLNMFNLKSPRLFVGVILFACGLLLCLYHAFSRRKKTDFEKITMLFFVVITNLGVGVIGSLHLLEETEGIMVVFPVWNIASSLYLILLHRARILNASCIIDEDTTTKAALMETVMIILIALMCQYVFKLHWSLILSVCMTYALSISGFIHWLAKMKNPGAAPELNAKK